MKDFFHHLFLPRTSNNHKAKLLHHKGLFILLIALLLLEGVLITTEKKYTGVLGISSSITIQELLDQTNKKRAENGLGPLSLSDQLVNAANAKGADMFAKDYWAHVAPDGATPWGFIRGAGYEYLYAGENLARGFTTTNDVMDAWMASPGHRENILSANYKDVGFSIQTGTLTGDETVLVVEEFGSRMSPDTQKDLSTAAVSQAPAQATQPTAVPTPRALARANQPSPTPLPTSLPSATPTIVSPPLTQITPALPPKQLVAAFSSKPLIDAPTLRKNIVLIIVGALLITLILDLVIIERRKIVRIFVHNIDHIIYLAIILIAVLLLGRGGIL